MRTLSCRQIQSSVLLVALLAGIPCAAQNDQTAKNNSDDAMLARAGMSLASLYGQMRDPDSFVLEKVTRRTIEPLTAEQAKRIGKKQARAYAATVGTEIFCFEFRARNGFGGMNREIAQARGEVRAVIFEKSVAELTNPNGCEGDDLTAHLREWAAKQTEKP